METRDPSQSRILRAIERFSFFFLSYISKRESFGWARGAEGASYARIAPLNLRLQHTCGESGETLCIDDKMGCETKKNILHIPYV